MSAEPGTGLKVGGRVPAFSEADVEAGQPISSKTHSG